MIPAILKRKLFEFPHPNWILWLGISFPLGVIFFFIPYEQADGVQSDWSTVVDYFPFLLQNSIFDLRHGLFSDLFISCVDDLAQPFIHTVYIPIMIGCFGQYIVMFIRYTFRRQTSKET
jgi:hypothetical protein